MSGLTISLLGPPQLNRDTQPITERVYGKALALLAYLAVEADRAHPRSAIAALLWPESPEDRARHNLRQALTVLRRVVGQDGATPCLVQQRDVLRFSPDVNAAVDVWDFQRLIDGRESHPHATAASCPSCCERLEQALSLYRGEFLHGFSVPDSEEFEGWAMTWRERLQDQALMALEGLATCAAEGGDRDAAIIAARRAVELEPLREPAWRRLMTLHWEAGNRSAALAAFERCQEILEEELGVRPEPETLALHEAIRSGAPPSLTTSPVSATPAPELIRIPAAPTRLIGRQQETRDIMDLLSRPDCRLLTLTGPGGSGKTHLATHIATEWADRAAGMTCFVPLESVRDGEEMAIAIADALGLDLRGADAPDRNLLSWLRDRGGVLLLDSAEHLLHHLSLLPAMLSAAPDLTILVTSRERLHLPGEWVYAIGGLPFPRDPLSDGFEGYDAVELLAERLRQARGGAPLHHEERPDIVRICQLVDGMPLGIELAAAWAHTLTAAEIADGIHQNLDFLQAPRGQPDHHLSMRAVFNSSWRMLTDSEQLAYMRLSVFRDGFDARAAQAVADTTLQSLAALMSKSLLTRLPSGRYRLHPLLAQFGEELHQQDAEEHAAIHGRHSRYYLDLLARQETLLRGADQPAAITVIGDDLENVRAAWEWGVRHGMLAELLSAAFSFWLFFVIHGWMREGEATFGAMLEALESGTLAAQTATTDPALPLAMARVYTGGFRSGLGRYDEAIGLLEAGIAILRDRDVRSPLGLGLNMLAAALLLNGDAVAARDGLQASLAVFRDVGDAWGTAFSLNDLGVVLYRHFDDQDAEHLCAESRETFRRLGDRRGQAFAASSLARIAMERAEYPRALRLHREALGLREEIDDRWGVAMSHLQLGRILAATGDRERARDHLMRALRGGWNMSITPIVLEAMAELTANDLLAGSDVDARQVLATIAAHPATPEAVSERARALLGEETPDVDERHATRAVNSLARTFLTGDAA